MEIWETVGLWHYPIPGFFLLAQFCLGVLVAIGNLVNYSVFLYLTDEDGGSGNEECTVEGKELNSGKGQIEKNAFFTSLSDSHLKWQLFDLNFISKLSRACSKV